MADDSPSNDANDSFVETSSAPGDDGTVSSDSYTETTSTSWLQKLVGSVFAVLIGIVLLIATGIGLFWNEGRAVQTTRSLLEGAAQVVSVESARVDPAQEGKLIHLQGDLTTTTPLSDPDLLVSVKAARLVRHVEMYQWKEESHTETQKKLGGGEDKITTYTYSRVWSDSTADSSRFKRASGHENPPRRFNRLEISARDGRLGAFAPGAAVLHGLPADQDLRVESEAAQRLGNRVGPVQAVDGKLYLGADPGNPRVGDLRIGYQIAPVGPISLIGRQTGADLQPFGTKAGDTILLAATGLVPASAMFATAEHDNMVLTWILRLVGFVVMWIAFALLFAPLSAIGDLVPFVGDLVGAGAALFAFLLAAVFAPLVIAIAWFASRPLFALAVAAGGIVVALGLRTLIRNRHARQRPGAMPSGAAPA